jgi:hypothetical protein
MRIWSLLGGLFDPADGPRAVAGCFLLTAAYVSVSHFTFSGCEPPLLGISMVDFWMAQWYELRSCNAGLLSVVLLY